MATKEELEELLKEGKTITKIAEMYKVSHTTVSRWIKKLGVAEKGNNLTIMTELEERILELRDEGMTYHAIQLKLGNPSKKMIKTTIRKYAPDLAGDVVENRQRWK